MASFTYVLSFIQAYGFQEVWITLPKQTFNPKIRYTHRLFIQYINLSRESDPFPKKFWKMVNPNVLLTKHSESLLESTLKMRLVHEPHPDDVPQPWPELRKRF